MTNTEARPTPNNTSRVADRSVPAICLYQGLSVPEVCLYQWFPCCWYSGAMVHCFLVHTVCPVGGLDPGDSRVLFSRRFGPDEDLEEDQDQDPQDPQLGAEQRRSLQRDKMQVVARQVLSAVTLSREASGRAAAVGGAGAGATDEASALQDADGGVLRLRAGDPFAGECSAPWLAVQSLAFTLVCGPHENLLLAEGTLRSLARHALEHLHMLGHGTEVLLKVDRIDFLLSKLLPHGQLLFLNHRFTQSLEKDVSAYMAK
ncbi:hypothetical protein CRUP_004540 [Coryphaenoides rupestris]|nr:hypothetical protein CRUP_004540 [Coryphaenoides rupestris]